MNSELLPSEALVRYRPGYITARDVARPLFRHRRPAILLFLAISVSVITIALLLPKTYQAEMKVLVKHERLDPIVSADAQQAGRSGNDVSDTEINSEVELLKGRDLLEATAKAAGLISPAASGPGARREISDVVTRLEHDLAVKPVRKTTLIEVTYSAHDPQMATRVLMELS